MGNFIYGAGRTAVELDDRVLAHLEVVIISKMRRNESVVFTVAIPADTGSGRRAFWIHPTTDLEFHFLGGRPPRINRAWVESLMATANSGSGLRITAEPAPEDEQIS